MLADLAREQTWPVSIFSDYPLGYSRYINLPSSSMLGPSNLNVLCPLASLRALCSLISWQHIDCPEYHWQDASMTFPLTPPSLKSHFDEGEEKKRWTFWSACYEMGKRHCRENFRKCSSSIIMTKHSNAETHAAKMWKHLVSVHLSLQDCGLWGTTLRGTWNSNP